MDFKLSKYCIPIDDTEDSIILYHSVTGGIIHLEKSIFQKINGTSCDKDVPFFDTLQQQHYIVPKSQDEFQLLKLREYEARSTNVKTLSYIIAPTTACNLNCVYCFEAGFRTHNKIDLKTIDGIFEFIINEVKKINTVCTVKITWFGGEPLLCFNEILEIGKQLKEKLSLLGIKFKSGIITNGILLTKEKALLLKEQTNLYNAQITIDGLKEEYCKIKHATPQDYDTLLKNICDIYKDIKINIRLNTNKCNIGAMYSLADMLYNELGLRKNINLYLAPIKDYANCSESNNCFGYEEFENIKYEFYTYLKQKGYIDESNKLKRIPPLYKFTICGIAKTNNFVIGPCGELYKCEHYLGHEDKIIGDVFNGVYYSDYYFETLNGINNDTCKECNLYPICQCRCDALFSLVKLEKSNCSHYDDLFASLTNSVKRYIKEKS